MFKAHQSMAKAPTLRQNLRQKEIGDGPPPFIPCCASEDWRRRGGSRRASRGGCCARLGQAGQEGLGKGSRGTRKWRGFDTEKSIHSLYSFSCGFDTEKSALGIKDVAMAGGLKASGLYILQVCLANDCDHLIVSRPVGSA